MASSTMRLSGLISGMDTESIIQQLVSAKQTKVDDAKKAQTKQEWKQTAWKELNTKIKNLQSKFVNNMRFESAYSKRVTKVSDSNAVSVITGDGAMTGVQNLKVSQLAKTAYMTGGKLTLKGRGERPLPAFRQRNRDIFAGLLTDAWRSESGRVAFGYACLVQRNTQPDFQQERRSA